MSLITNLLAKMFRLDSGRGEGISKKEETTDTRVTQVSQNIISQSNKGNENTKTNQLDQHGALQKMPGEAEEQHAVITKFSQNIISQSKEMDFHIEIGDLDRQIEELEGKLKTTEADFDRAASTSQPLNDLDSKLRADPANDQLKKDLEDAWAYNNITLKSELQLIYSKIFYLKEGLAHAKECKEIINDLSEQKKRLKGAEEELGKLYDEIEVKKNLKTEKGNALITKEYKKLLEDYDKKVNFINNICYYIKNRENDLKETYQKI